MLENIDLLVEIITVKFAKKCLTIFSHAGESRYHVFKRALCLYICLSHIASLQRQTRRSGSLTFILGEKMRFCSGRGKELLRFTEKGKSCDFLWSRWFSVTSAHMLWVAKSQLGSADTLLYSRATLPAYICLGMNSSNRSAAKCAGQQRKSAWVTLSFWGGRVRKGMNL